MSYIAYIKIAFCSLILCCFASTTLMAQTKPAPKPEVLDKDALPKLEKAVIGGGIYGNGAVVDFGKKGMQEELKLSEVAIKDHSEVDGKMSKFERDLLKRARRQPQTE